MVLRPEGWQTQHFSKIYEGLWRMFLHEKYLPHHDRMDIVKNEVPKQILRGDPKIAIIALDLASGLKSFQEGYLLKRPNWTYI